jgi:hypothetical protein
LEIDWDLAEEEYKKTLAERPEAKRAKKRSRINEEQMQRVGTLLKRSDGFTNG